MSVLFLKHVRGFVVQGVDLFVFCACVSFVENLILDVRFFNHGTSMV